MRERPILFNGAMVRAILSGAKTQTRRAVKVPPAFDFIGGSGDDRNDPANWGAEDEDARWWALAAGPDTDHVLPCPFGQPGDRLWVRENGLEYRRTRLFIHDATPGRWWTPEDGGRYGASYGQAITRESLLRDHKVRPSIHMPRWACRLVLEITGVRVERLQAISEADALAEGVDASSVESFTRAGVERPAGFAFRDLWTSTGGDWDSNPWVWAIDFRRVTP